MGSSQIAYNKTRPSNLKACLDELAPSATTTGQPVARQKWDTYKSGHLGCLTGHEVLVFKGKHEEDAMSFTPDIALLLVAGATVTAIDASELESLKSWTSWFGGRDWQGKAFWLIWREAEWELVKDSGANLPMRRMQDVYRQHPLGLGRLQAGKDWRQWFNNPANCAMKFHCPLDYPLPPDIIPAHSVTASHPPLTPIVDDSESNVQESDNDDASSGDKSDSEMIKPAKPLPLGFPPINPPPPAIARAFSWLNIDRFELTRSHPSTWSAPGSLSHPAEQGDQSKHAPPDKMME